MDAIRKTVTVLTFLLAGGCATVDNVADSPADQAPATDSNKSRSLHVITLTHEPVEPFDDSAYDSAADSTTTNEVIIEEPPEFWEQLRQGFRLPGSQQTVVTARAAGYGRNPQQVERVFKRGEPYLAYILSEVQKRNFPTEIALLPFVESGYDPFAFSYGRAAGMWQFIPATGKMYGLQQDWWYDGRRDVVESTQAALNYLDYLQDKFDGDWLLAVAAYNSGSGTVSKAIKNNRKAGKPTDFWHLKLPKETAAYVPKLLAISRVVRHPDKYDISLSPVGMQPAFTVIETPGQMDISVAAGLAGMNTEALYLLNPGYNRWTTHPDGPHQLVIPVDHSTVFRQNIATLSESQLTRLVRHKVQSGETLSQIAQRYNTTTNALISSNQLSNTLIRSGQYLLVPVGNQDASQYATLNRRIQAANGARSKQTYNVRHGDSLWTIARKHRVTVQQVSSWNKLDAGAPIKPGQKLVIYKNSTGSHAANRVKTVVYTVRSGDSLYLISKKFNVSVNDLRRWNNLGKDKYLQPGQNLKLYVDVTHVTGNSQG
ncbi:MAG: LysM peptidoglycan-binding domain-containing protein [Gammaproteobacteria bacterium]|jgi:membrane-bound lytic murein transglycosylase D